MFQEELQSAEKQYLLDNFYPGLKDRYQSPDSNRHLFEDDIQRIINSSKDQDFLERMEKVKEHRRALLEEYLSTTN